MKRDLLDHASDDPIAWFLVLEQSRRNGDFERARDALAELARLGVVVKYFDPVVTRRARPTPPADADASENGGES